MISNILLISWFPVPIPLKDPLLISFCQGPTFYFNSLSLWFVSPLILSLISVSLKIPLVAAFFLPIFVICYNPSHLLFTPLWDIYQLISHQLFFYSATIHHPFGFALWCFHLSFSISSFIFHYFFPSLTYLLSRLLTNLPISLLMSVSNPSTYNCFASSLLVSKLEAFRNHIHLSLLPYKLYCWHIHPSSWIFHVITTQEIKQ